MRRLEFSRSAIRDLEAIDGHTIAEFGPRQADQLRERFDAAFRGLQPCPVRAASGRNWVLRNAGCGRSW
jgi:plasmid stabilization system protein ParE